MPSAARDAAGAARRAGPRCCSARSSCACAALVFLLVPRALIGVHHRRVGGAIGMSLLFVAADLPALRRPAGGRHRRAARHGDTRTPMLWNLAGHWFGLPVGYLLCFNAGRWRDRHLVGALGGPNHLRRRARGGMVAPDTPTGGVSAALKVGLEPRPKLFRGGSHA